MGSIAEEPEVRDFPSLPPFPKNVPIVPLHRISLENLLAGDKNEEEKLWQASTELGFFYLDLRGSSDTTIPSTITAVSSSPTNSATGTTLLKTSTTLFTLGEKVFELPTEEKVTYDLKDKGSYFGYKGLGAGVIDSKGTRDLNEFWNISKDDILSPSPTLPNPELLKTEDSRALLREFITASHSVVRLVLSILNGKLGLPEGVLEGLHRLEGESGDQVRWVKSPPQKRDAKQVALGEHTDFGSVTVLFNRLGGLQVLLPGEDQEWTYVRPVEGCCVVNLGDALVRFTRGVLRSNIHRVVNPPGEQESETRYSLVYFARPEDQVLLGGLEGSAVIDAMSKNGDGDGEEEEEITAKEWILRRALGRRAGGDYGKSFGTEKGRLGAK